MALTAVGRLIDDVRYSARESWADAGLSLLELKRLLLHNTLLASGAALVCIAGGSCFRIIEGWHEEIHKCEVQRTRLVIIDELWNKASYLEEDVWRSLARERLLEHEAAVSAARDEAGISTPSTARVWTLWGAIHYAFTVLTSIGYGNIAPSTTTGQALTMVYAAIGIPLLLMVLADFGKLFTRSIKVVWAFIRRFYYTGSCRRVRMAASVKAVGKIMGADGSVGGDDEEPPPYSVDEKFDLPVSIALTLLLLYVLLGGLIFIQWEDWTYFQAVYFVFISLSTIGFGDFVPRHPSYLMATFVYLLFGLALTSMCINVIQESLTNTFREATLKIGTRMGLGLEEGQHPAVTVEMAAVHDSDKHKKKE